MATKTAKKNTSSSMKCTPRKAPRIYTTKVGDHRLQLSFSGTASRTCMGVPPVFGDCYWVLVLVFSQASMWAVASGPAFKKDYF